MKDFQERGNLPNPFVMFNSFLNQTSVCLSTASWIFLFEAIIYSCLSNKKYGLEETLKVLSSRWLLLCGRRS